MTRFRFDVELAGRRRSHGGPPLYSRDALMVNIDLRSLARALGGEVSGNQVLAPGPNHSSKDRSLSVKLDADAPDGFVVHSFAHDDPIQCRDHVREKAGLAPFKPNGKRKPAFEISKVIAAQT